ncbi:MAG: EAL domain-containing protein [Betaproteobacteria bacterium]
MAHTVRVLLVEDERSSAMVVEQHLRAMASVQCQLDTVRTLDQALERLSRERFDLIIADLHLPDSPAEETVERLARRCELPIIALTIDESVELRERALRSGAYDYLTKGQLGAGALERPVRLAALQAYTFRSLRESEARLKESEERFRKLTELSSDFYWEQDAEARITFMSRWLGQKSGLDAHAYLGRRPWDQPALNLTEADWARHRAQLERHEPFRDFELHRQTPDGRSVWLAISGEPVFDAQGRFTGYRGVGRDITERRRAEQALRDSEARFRNLIELSYDFYWETDIEHRLTRTTHPDKHRPASQPVIGKTRWDLPSTYPDAAGWAAHRAALDARQPFRDFEIGRIDPDGVERWLSISGEPALDEAGSFVGYRGVGRDISERRREQRLVSLEHAVARLLADADTAAEAVRGVMREICKTERWDCARYFMVDESASLMRFSLAWCEPGSPMQGFCDASAGLTYAPGEGLIGIAWQSGEPLWIDNARNDPRVKAKALAQQAAIHGSLVFQLAFAGRTVGMLSFSSTTVRKPDERLLGTMRAIGSQVGQFLQRKQAEAAQLRFRTALDSSADMVFLFDLDQGRLLDFNETSCTYLGYTREELLSLHARDIRVGMTRDRLQDEMRHLLASAGRSNTVQTAYRRKDGSAFPVESRRSILETPSGRVLVVNSRDLTERQSAERRRAAQARYQKKIARLGQAALTMRDASDLIGRAVDSVLDALGGSGSAAVAYVERGTGAGEIVLRRVGGRPAAAAQAPVAACAPDAPLAQALAQSQPAVLGAPWGVAAPLPFAWAAKFSSAAMVPVPGDGGARAVLCALSAERAAFGPEETRFLGAAASLLSAALHRVDSETRLAYMAQFDGLTGLPNRALLADRFTQMIVQARRRGTSLGVLFIDLDEFKLVNDTQGHAAGDELLKEVARRLKSSVRPGDTVARISGDEFAVVLVDLMRPDDAAIVAQKILERLAAPVAIGGQELFTSASVGISTCPADGADAETLLGAADAAMYRAKESGRNGFQFFTAEINQRTRARAQLGHELRRAIERREFELAYQPKVDLAGGEVCGAEALLRWRHPERGKIEPVEFIPVLEETGLIVQVGEWVLRQACEDVKRWREAGLPPTPVAVNLSARQFRQQDLDARLRGIVEAAGVDASLIELEITESHLMHDPEHAVRVLRSLGAAGLRIAIDDFGTGYSSLAYLTRFPLTSLKIDRSFVADALEDEADATIVRTIVDMAHTLGFTVIAEGVETDQQAAFLRALGCEAGQGFLFAGPMPAADFAAYIESAQASTSARAAAPTRRRPLRRTS